MSHIITQHQGKTLPYLPLSVFSGVIAFISLFFLPWLAIPFIAFIIVLSMIETGIAFDVQENKLRYYFKFGNFTWGKWKKLDCISTLELEMDVLYPKRYRRSSGQLSPSSTQPIYISYDLYAFSSSNVKQLIYEFEEYKYAVLFANQLQSALNCPLKNDIQEKIMANKQRRYTRLARRKR